MAFARRIREAVEIADPRFQSSQLAMVIHELVMDLEGKGRALGDNEQQALHDMVDKVNGILLPALWLILSDSSRPKARTAVLSWSYNDSEAAVKTRMRFTECLSNPEKFSQWLASRGGA